MTDITAAAPHAWDATSWQRRVGLAILQQVHPLTGPALCIVRVLLGLSQNELAAQVGVRRLTVTRWECGRHNPRPATALRVRRFVRARLGYAPPPSLGLH